jgi:hypothetical protein
MGCQVIYDFINSPEHYTACKANATGVAQKKPVAVAFYVLKEIQHFVTTSGTQTGNVGDYVLIGKDHAWPVSKEYFEENYEVKK